MKQKKIQKPIEIEAHLKYQCPRCNQSHWLSLNEAKTKNFKIVCDCKKVFIPKRISKLDIVYSTNIKSKEKLVKPISESKIDKALKDKCVKALIDCGFSSSESDDLIENAYSEINCDDPVSLVKKAISIFGVKNNE